MTNDLKWEMQLLPPDYLHGANRTDRKPALYVTVRVFKFLESEEDLFVDTQKRDGMRHTIPYHPHAQAINRDMGGNSLPTEEWAYCHYPDATQRELALYPWADHTNGPWVVVVGMCTMTHYSAAFCTRSLNQTMPNWHNYSTGNMDGHPYMKLPNSLSEILAGEYTTVVMESTKTMKDL